MLPVIETLILLKALPLAKEGDCFWVTEENCAYVYTNGGWSPQDKNSDIALGSLYDINKGVVAQLPVYTPEQIMCMLDLINEFIANTENKYYMLLSNELHYYTVFTRTGSGEPIPEAFLSCIEGWMVKSAELTPDNSAIEIWIEIPEEGVYVLYFFPYDLGVCECA